MPCGACTSRSPLLVGSPLQVSHHMPVGCTFTQCLKLSPATETALQFLQNHTESPQSLLNSALLVGLTLQHPPRALLTGNLGAFSQLHFLQSHLQVTPRPHSLLAKWRAPKGLLIPAAKKKAVPSPWWLLWLPALLLPPGHLCSPPVLPSTGPAPSPAPGETSLAPCWPWVLESTVPCSRQVLLRASCVLC